MTEPAEAQNWTDIFYSSQDGLRLYARHYPALSESVGAVVCLPGLTRNSKDFHLLATHLSGTPERSFEVYCLDFRGRGRSAYDRDWSNYTPFIELLDTLDFMTITGLHDASVIGTSRGGIIAMLIAVLRPTALRSVVLNDIGPVIDPRGLARILGYVGLVPLPETWPEAARILREMNGPFFPAIPDDEWPELARQWFAEEDWRPAPSYDPNLAKALGAAELSQKSPELWPQFMALGKFPTLVVRGENSDILNEETLAEMGRQHPGLQVQIVRGQGHAPLLRDAETIGRIAEFLGLEDETAAAETDVQSAARR